VVSEWGVQRRGDNNPAGIKMEPCQTAVIQSKHGKPYALSIRRNPTARKGDSAEGKGVQRKRMHRCNGADRVIPTLKGG